MEVKEEKKVLAHIAATIAGVSLAIVTIFAIFAREQIWEVVPIFAALVLMGIVLGYFASRKG